MRWILFETVISTFFAELTYGVLTLTDSFIGFFFGLVVVSVFLYVGLGGDTCKKTPFLDIFEPIWNAAIATASRALFYFL